MSEKNRAVTPNQTDAQAHVLCVYPELSYRDSHDFAEDVMSALRYEELLAQGYEPMGIITKDTTKEELDEMAERIGNKIAPALGVPAEDDPIWDALTKAVYDDFSWHDKYIISCTVPGATQEELEAAYQDAMARGEDEAEWCLARINNDGVGLLC